MNFLPLIAPLMVMTHFFESPFVVVGLDPCTEAMLEKELNEENLIEFEKCLKRKNYYREAGGI